VSLYRYILVVFTVTPVRDAQDEKKPEIRLSHDCAPLIFREPPNYLNELIRTARKYVPEPVENPAGTAG
jgi:hypothetical protein